MWDALVHQTLPNVVIAVFSMALLARVLWRKYQVQHRIQWRRHRKMTVQLLSISLLYLIFAFPLTLMNLMYICCLPANVGGEVWDYFLLFNYGLLLFVPFACTLSLPQLRKKLRVTLRLVRRAGTVMPTM